MISIEMKCAWCGWTHEYCECPECPPDGMEHEDMCTGCQNHTFDDYGHVVCEAPFCGPCEDGDHFMCQVTGCSCPGDCYQEPECECYELSFGSHSSYCPMAYAGGVA
jgi:hypothetical protein